MDRPTSSGRPPSATADPDDSVAVGDTTPAGATDDQAARRDGSGAAAGARFRDLRPGDVLGRYQLIEEIGAGGMATVYRARDGQLRRAVAVKVLHPHLAKRPELVARFHREARAAAKLDHPGVVRVLDVGGKERPQGPDDEPPFMVLDLIVGTSLEELARAHAPLLGEIVAAIGVVVAAALAHAHDAGIVHRDLKPSNLLASTDGRLLLADFGVARLDDDDSEVATRTGALLGTPSFMSPEQAGGQRVDLRSDLYSLGATLYQLATGAAPYGGSTAKVISSIALGDRLAVERRNPAVGVALSRVIEGSMSLDPADRPQTATELGEALSAVLDEAGLGSAAEIVARFLAAPAEASRLLAKAALASTLARAREAARAGSLPRALALANRAYALQPTDAEASQLVEELGRQRGRRRWLVAGAGAVALVAAGAVAMIGFTAGEGGRTAAVVPVADAATVDSVPADHGQTVLGAALDAGSSSAPADVAVARALEFDAGARRHGSGRARADAGARVADIAPRQPAADAAVADAGAKATAATEPLTPTSQGAVAPASLRIDSDAWCNLLVDGEARGRLDSTRSYPVAPGTHELLCSQGPGLGSWSSTVTVAAGEVRQLVARLLTPVRVRIEIAGAEVITVSGTRTRSGQTLQLPPGRYRVEIRRAGATAVAGWVSVPRVRACTVRDQPSLDCYR